MKIRGLSVPAPEPEILVIPRGDEKFVFKMGTIPDDSVFLSLCPVPQPPTIKRRGEDEAVPDYKDKSYIEKVNVHSKRRVAWMIMQSLKATDGLVWETVDENDCTTWENCLDELQKSGLLDKELSRIIDCVFTVCGLNQDKINKATEDFLAEKAAAK